MVAIADQLPVVEQDPTEPAFVQNPYNFYRHIRALGDFVFWKEYERPIATTQAGVAQVLRHPKLGRAMPDGAQIPVLEEMKPFYDLEEFSLLELEGPDHARIRRLAMEGFGRTPMAMMAPTVSQIADRLIDAFPDNERFDLLSSYAQPLTALTITEFLGVDPEQSHQMQIWSNAMVAIYQARRDQEVERASANAAKELSQLVNEFILFLSKKPNDGFLCKLMSAEKEGVISRGELVSTVVLLLNAGQQATAHAIGNAVNLLAAFPERTLALQPENIAATVEECLRFDPPLHLFSRFVYQSVSLLGIDFPSGSVVGCLLGSSCRDDAVWPDGEKFDPFRARRNHQAFGVGLHACVGASLARLEMQIALPALFSRCPELTIVTPPTVANLYHFHGLERLDVQVR